MTVQILNIRPAPAGAGGRTVAHVDLQLTDDCRLFNLKLVDAPNGRRIYAPSAFGANTATFSPTLSAELIRAIEAALGGKPDYAAINS